MAKAAFLRSIISVSLGSVSVAQKRPNSKQVSLLRNSHNTAVSDPRGPSHARWRSAHADRDTWSESARDVIHPHKAGESPLTTVARGIKSYPHNPSHFTCEIGDSYRRVGDRTDMLLR